MQDCVVLVGWPKNGFTIGPEAINVKMAAGHAIASADPEKFRADSFEQLFNGVEVMRRAGREVFDTKPEHGGGDSVFKRDNFIVIDDKIVLARHASSTRRPEIEDIRRIVKEEYIIELKRPGSFFEGGDFLNELSTLNKVDCTIPVAWGPRTPMEAIKELQGLFRHKRFLPLELNEPHFYGDERVLSGAGYIHGDTAAFFKSTHDLAIYRPAFTEAGWRAAEELACEHRGDIYQLSKKEAEGFAANMQEISPGEIISVPLDMDPEKPGELRNWLQRDGTIVHEVACPNFNLSDGAWNCLTKKIPRKMLKPEALAQLERQTRIADARRLLANVRQAAHG